MQKPDGLTIVPSSELPQRLFHLKLIDLPGIGQRTQQRLIQRGVTTVEKLCDLTLHEMCQAWESKVLGELWHHRLRGDDLPEGPTKNKSISHSHVLAPEFRNERDAKGVLVVLLHKAAARLRKAGYWARSLDLCVDHLGGPKWRKHQRLDPCRDTLTLLQTLGSLWRHRPDQAPMKVGLVLGDLVRDDSVERSLFESESNLVKLSAAMDALNQRFGSNKVYFAGMHGLHCAAPDRIAFGHIPEIQKTP